MKESNSIVVPVDLDNPADSADVLRFAHRMCAEKTITATLLYVINLNIARLPVRVYEEMAATSEVELKGLANVFGTGGRNVNTSVRFGIPHVEIVAEAASRQSELIIMSCPKQSRFGWLRSLGTVGNVMRHAPCPTLVLPRDGSTIPEYLESWRPLDLVMVKGGQN